MLKNLIVAATGIATVLVSSAILADVSIGVIAPRGKDNANKRWSEYASHLTKDIGEKVKIIPFLPNEILKSTDKVNFMLANPTQAVILMETKNAANLATLNKKGGAQFGGVIVARKDSGIKVSNDLIGKKVMGLKFGAAAGAYLFQTYHLVKKGINPHEDFSSFTEGKKQDELVMKVKNGSIDAAFIRTGILENMTRENKININDFVVIDRETGENSRIARTTRLYPEWSLLAMSGTNSGLVNKIKRATLNVDSHSKAAENAKILGFVRAIDMQPMKDVMMELGVFPYDD